MTSQARQQVFQQDKVSSASSLGIQTLVLSYDKRWLVDLKTNKNLVGSWGGGSVVKAFTLQARGPEFESPEPLKKLSNLAGMCSFGAPVVSLKAETNDSMGAQRQW